MSRKGRGARTTGATDRALLVRSARELKGWWRWVGLIGLLELLATPLSLLGPVPLAIAVDSAIGDEPLAGAFDGFVPSSMDPNQAALIVACVLQVVVTVGSQARSFAGTYVQTRVSERATLDIRGRMLAHAQRLSFRFHDRRGTSDSVYRILYDANSIPSLATSALIPFVAAIVTLVAMLVVIIGVDTQLAVVALGIAPILYVAARLYRPRMKARYRDAKKIDSAAMKKVQEVFTAFRVVKAFGTEEWEGERYREHAGASADAKVRVAVIEGWYSLLLGAVTATGTALVLYLGVQRVNAGGLTVGALLLVLSYLGQLYGPLERISRQSGKLQNQLTGAERVYELLDQEPEVKDAPDAVGLDRAVGEFRLEGVCFAYEPDQGVLVDVDAVVPVGSTVGVVGRTGAGKSTLVSLLSRFYDVTAGRITLDGRDIREYRVADLRRQFAVVLQDPFLFSTSILDNIRYARPDASLADVQEAAKSAEVHEFIASLPDGYDTVVGERGMRLSGGERQRLSLARAFLLDAPVLLLDEPTSSVDVETEASIMEAMRRLMQGRTTFMIAHRLSTLDDCTMILKVADGHVEQVGRADTTRADLDQRDTGEPSGPTDGDGAELDLGDGSVRLGVDGGRSAVTSVNDEAADEACVAAEVLVPGFRASSTVPYPAARRRSAAYHVVDQRTGEAVSLKLERAKAAAVEDHVYRVVLPKVPVRSVRGYGAWLSPSRRGHAWLATDHVEAVDLNVGLSDHREALTSWTATLHARARFLREVRTLPVKDQWHWRAIIEDAQFVLGTGLGNQNLAQDEVEVVTEMHHLLASLLESWSGVVGLLDAAPATLTHGDLTTRNVKILGTGPPRPMVLDWETAGFGSPMIDLLWVDLPLYHRLTEQQAGPAEGVSLDTLERLRALGRVCWTASVLIGERVNLESPWPHRAVAKLPAYMSRIADDDGLDLLQLGNLR